jgi:hypothetical protein
VGRSLHVAHSTSRERDLSASDVATIAAPLLEYSACVSAGSDTDIGPVGYARAAVDRIVWSMSVRRTAAIVPPNSSNIWERL